jgi:hypothetical protein
LFFQYAFRPSGRQSQGRIGQTDPERNTKEKPGRPACYFNRRFQPDPRNRTNQIDFGPIKRCQI